MSGPLHLGWRLPEIVFYEKVESWSGKYLCFFGIHYVGGAPCYDVGASNRETGLITRRHYSDKDNIAPEASAKTFWEEFKAGMIKKPDAPEELSLAAELEQWLDIHDPSWAKRRPN